jgi:hypothetical protein
MKELSGSTGRIRSLTGLCKLSRPNLLSLLRSGIRTVWASNLVPGRTQVPRCFIVFPHFLDRIHKFLLALPAPIRPLVFICLGVTGPAQDAERLRPKIGLNFLLGGARPAQEAERLRPAAESRSPRDRRMQLGPLISI